MSGFVLTNRSENIFGNIPFLRGHVYNNICVTCEHLESRPSHAEFKPIFTCVPDSICHYWKSHVRTRFPNPQTSKQRQSPCCATWRSTLLFWGHRGIQEKPRWGKYMEGIPKFGWHQFCKTKCLSNSNLWFVGDFVRMRWLENCKTSGLIWTRWWFVGEVGFRYGSLGSGLLGKEPMFS